MDLNLIGGRRVFCTGISSLYFPVRSFFGCSRTCSSCVRSMFYHQLPRGGSHRNRWALMPEPQQQQWMFVPRRVYIKHARQSRNDILESTTTPSPSYQSSTESRSATLWSHINWLSKMFLEMINSRIVHTQVRGGVGGDQAMKPFGYRTSSSGVDGGSAISSLTM